MAHLGHTTGYDGSVGHLMGLQIGPIYNYAIRFTKKKKLSYDKLHECYSKNEEGRKEGRGKRTYNIKKKSLYILNVSVKAIDYFFIPTDLSFTKLMFIKNFFLIGRFLPNWLLDVFKKEKLYSY